MYFIIYTIYLIFVTFKKYFLIICHLLLLFLVFEYAYQKPAAIYLQANFFYLMTHCINISNSYILI